MATPKVQKKSTKRGPVAVAKRDRGHVFSAECPSRGVLIHVTSRWGALVLVALLSGTYRFSELRRKISGVSEKMLSQTLHVLEADGMVLRLALPVIPPHVEYSLTSIGVEAAHHVESLVTWIEANLSRVMDARAEHAKRSGTATTGAPR